MDWKNLFLSADGRIGRQTFWIGIAILFGANIVLGFIPIIGQFIGLALIYCSVCVYSKRLHDMGKSGWLQLAPMVICFVLLAGGLASLGGAAVMGAMSGNEEMMAGAAMGGLGIAFMTIGLALVVGFGFLLWVGLTPSEPGPNKYDRAADESLATG